MERIFDPYFTTKGIEEGTGLGLSVVHGIVKNQGGGIQVTSKLGQGSVFRVYLPAIQKDPKDLPETAYKIPGGNERILLIDDEEMLVELTKELLTALGYQVEGFNNPVKAVAAFSAEPDRFDLVITDMTMPKMTGDRVAQEILSIRPDMPIILCTGFNQKMSAETALDIGITGYAEKPVDMKTMAEKVRAAIDRKM
jgi:CheY-like chemotaxis protein